MEIAVLHVETPCFENEEGWSYMYMRAFVRLSCKSLGHLQNRKPPNPENRRKIGKK